MCQGSSAFETVCQAKRASAPTIVPTSRKRLFMGPRTGERSLSLWLEGAVAEEGW
jgi:hypothetical protein